jgi:hypothetical protein
MTSFLLLVESGRFWKKNKFQPSFNMGLSRKALKSQRLWNIHPGEDPTYRYGFGSSVLNQTVSKCVCIS